MILACGQRVPKSINAASLAQFPLAELIPDQPNSAALSEALHES